MNEKTCKKQQGAGEILSYLLAAQGITHICTSICRFAILAAVALGATATAQAAMAFRWVATFSDPRCFGREFGPPALSADDQDYDPINGYWQGPIWPPTTYVLICGLRSCCEAEAARKIAHAWYNANAELFVREKTVFENIPPVRELIGKRNRKPGRDFCGWGALAPVAIPAEWPIDADINQALDFLLGLENFVSILCRFGVVKNLNLVYNTRRYTKRE